jgi:lipopolysaccharide transport system ATP-binding protein
MSDLAIKVDDVAKLYRLGVKEQAHENLGDAAMAFVKSPLKNFRKYRSLYKFDDVDMDADGQAEGNNTDILWALRGVSFEIKKGEIVGVIGTNGAGKSTLLKVLAKITPPTRGRIEIHGRVSSLLEVGTGFHPELTGRENVYLNGTILGMRKREIDSKFDEIVDFSGVEKFLDTPVKRYSSGMRVRLAFSVAAHLEPEILIIDEVLAVGDAAFQNKCLNKMQDVSRQGRTILFVSHNMPALTRLCPRAILLNEGKVLQDGKTEDIVGGYLHAGIGMTATRQWEDLSQAPGDETVRLRAVRAKNPDGEVNKGLDIRQAVGLEMEFEVLKKGIQLMPFITLTNKNGIKAFTAIDQDKEWRNRPRPEGRYVTTAWIPGNLLGEGVYYVRVTMRTPDRKRRPFDEGDVIAFKVNDSFEGDSARGDWVGSMGGVVRPMLDWETSYEPLLADARLASEV